MADVSDVSAEAPCARSPRRPRSGSLVQPRAPAVACHVQPGYENQCVDDEEMANGLLFVGNRMKEEEIKALQTQLGLDEANPLVRSMR